MSIYYLMRIGFERQRGRRNGMNKEEKRGCIYAISFVLVCFITLVAFVFSEIYPFGNRSLLIWDLRWQYVQFFEWFRRILLEGGNIFYSFNTGLGANMVGLYAYYLASPLNCLVIFFEDIQLFILILTIIKLGFAAVTCSIFLRNRCRSLSNVWVVLLAICYGTMSYTFSQKSNIMWLDGLVFLPLIAYGVYNVVENRKKGMLYGSVLLAIFSNWYIAYMCCLFSVIYFFYELIINKSYEKKVKDTFKVILSYGFTMALAVLSSMGLFLPTIINYREKE